MTKKDRVLDRIAAQPSSDRASAFLFAQVADGTKLASLCLGAS